MIKLQQLLVVFAAGSILGWLIEAPLRFAIHGHYVRPGYYYGPYLPLYGVTILILYLVYTSKIIENFKIILFVTIPTFVELLQGLKNIYINKIQLWDYSEYWLNYKGIISPITSVVFAVYALLAYFIFFPKVTPWLNKIKNSKSPKFWIPIIAFYLAYLIDIIITWNQFLK